MTQPSSSLNSSDKGSDDSISSPQCEAKAISSRVVIAPPSERSWYASINPSLLSWLITEKKLAKSLGSSRSGVNFPT